MKNLLIITLLFVSYASFAQSITIDPSYLQVPKFANNPSCNTSAKGRLIYNTSSNNLYYCNGTDWVSPETNIPVTPAFKASNDYFTPLSNDTYIPFTLESYDLANNFNLNNAAFSPNYFVAHKSGIYHFEVSTEWDLSNASLNNNSYVNFTFRLQRTNSAYNNTRTFYVSGNKYLTTSIATDFEMNVGDKVRVEILTKQITGTVTLLDTVFSGFLVSK